MAFTIETSRRQFRGELWGDIWIVSQSAGGPTGKRESRPSPLPAAPMVHAHYKGVAAVLKRARTALRKDPAQPNIDDIGIILAIFGLPRSWADRIGILTVDGEQRIAMMPHPDDVGLHGVFSSEVVVHFLESRLLGRPTGLLVDSFVRGDFQPAEAARELLAARYGVGIERVRSLLFRK